MHKQLTSEQRSQIFAYLQENVSRKTICERLGISQSTLCRELKRNCNKRGQYSWRFAHTQALERRERTCANRRTPAWLLHKALKYLIDKQWSPKQISGYLRKQGLIISHERIYQAIRADKTGMLKQHCRHKMKYRHHTGPRHKKAGKTMIPDRVSIHDRPIEADGTRFGDWEMDLIIGKGNKSACTLSNKSAQLDLEISSW